jgi:iron uptake system component EfeO
VRISVTQDPNTCELSQTSFASGIATFVIENVGETTSEFYIYKSDAKAIVAEVENIGSGLSRELTAELAEGTYVYSCEQMDGGTPIQGKLTISAATDPVEKDANAEAALATYKEFVIEQANQLLIATEEFAALIKAKDESGAKQLYAEAREFWERIEPVAESFGDLDPKIDAREGDLEEGVAWTGWHALEKQLWITGLDDSSAPLADQLVADTKDLVTRIATVELTLTQMSNGAKELMDEVATGKVTGEEERYSRTDLWDFAANVEGARKVVAVASDILEAKNPELLQTLNQRFDALEAELGAYQVNDGYRLYNELTQSQVKALADLVEAVSEPLSQMTASLVK